ncbi:Rap1 Myb domain-containing protein [Colletotrichum orchidophilum]|uniref:DNA-binding protein RAP1 n=1 Tax=Colletotrichum orchidophilum TaxID=1209926 RepID=A0A1G4BFY6_9PEZI|nr:Rap1 Myb domain-containing protein [Colletotrichum orchidophilum]OHF00281.1 Rap1 Myb domain-containing protein [Colletotrichum orchidophilum]
MSGGGITYHGVPGARGTLFKDLKFFVSMRVPDRLTILDLIKQNGGTIAKLETHADHYITHDRGPTPAGSLDWKFVKDSVDNGAIQEMDKYEMHRTPRASRPVGGPRPLAKSAPAKGTRTPFTATDDAILTKWVLSHAANKRSGNEIYQVFEEMVSSGLKIYVVVTVTNEAQNNRHTLHSWRDRWVKKLSKLPPAEIEKLAASASQIALPAPPTATTSSSRRETMRPIEKKAPLPVAQHTPRLPTVKATAKPSSSAHQPDVKAPLTPAKRTKFTGAEDDLLIREVGRFDGTPDTKFFKRFSEKHSNHSEGAWRRHWTQILEPRLRESSKESLAESGPLPEESPTVDTKAGPGTAPSGEPSRQNKSDQKKRPNDSDGRPTTLNKETTAPVVAPSGASTVGKKDDGKRLPETRIEESQAISRQYFFDHLEGYREFRRLDTQIKPEINDLPIDLWRLWQAVGDQYQQGAIETNWATVADVLGLDVGTAQLIQQCYADYIADFAASGVLDEPDVESDDDEGSQSGEDDAGPDVQIEPFQTHLEVTPSASRKRQAIIVDTAGLPSTPNSRKKRQRLGPDDEIPSTPDDRLGLASFNNLGPSPSLSVRRWANGEGQVGEVEEVAAEEEEPEQIPAGKPRRLEPETQDFGFDDAFNAPDKSQGSDEFDISPSQQLLGEIESVTPLPFSYKRDKGKGIDRDQLARGSPTEGREVEGEEDREAVETRDEPGGRAIPDSQDSADKTVELEDLMDRFISFGYPREDIVLALMATSLCTPLATSLLKHLIEHKQLPNNWQGVWTTNDDARLRRVDAAGSEGGPDEAKVQKYWDYLELKHTRLRIDQRRTFLAYLDDTGQSSQ